jgi:hypothetical protein
MDIDDIVISIILAFVALIIGIFYVFEVAFVFWKAWSWYMPALIPGIIKITYGQSMIAVIMFSVLGGNYFSSNTANEDDISKTISNLVGKLFSPVLVLFLIWLIKSFII